MKLRNKSLFIAGVLVLLLLLLAVFAAYSTAPKADVTTDPLLNNDSISNFSPSDQGIGGNDLPSPVSSAGGVLGY